MTIIREMPEADRAFFHNGTEYDVTFTMVRTQRNYTATSLNNELPVTEIQALICNTEQRDHEGKWVRLGTTYGKTVAAVIESLPRFIDSAELDGPIPF